MTDPVEQAGVWVEIPQGYAALPLTGIAETVEAVGKLVTELGPPNIREAGDTVLSSLQVFLETLAERRAVYCGVGRHRSALNDQLITSSLVVTLLEFPEENNPRLVLKDLLEAKAGAGEAGQTDLVDLPNGPALFFERVTLMPAPAIPGQHVLAEGVESPVWQLEAFVPSPQGDKLATIEVSTPFAEHGPQYRAMLVAMASGVVFEEPVDSDPLAALLG
ncbi:hypothetical protein [Winogradskya humida]|nr:hypothetical protein [Actinoplanes humidus]